MTVVERHDPTTWIVLVCLFVFFADVKLLLPPQMVLSSANIFSFLDLYQMKAA